MLKFLSRVKLLKKHFHFWDAFVLAIGLKTKREVISLPITRRKLFFRPSTKDKETFEEIFLSNLYDVILPIVPVNIIDAGANVGFATFFFKIKYPLSSIVAIEIENKNAICFKKNVSGFNDVDLKEAALYNKKSFFKVEDPYKATNSFQIVEVDSAESSDIESITIDEIIAEKKWKNIDLLKIDIEGAEKALFEENYQHWLPKTKILMIETHDRMVPKCSYTVMNTINSYNFILYTTTDGTLIYFNSDYIKLNY